MINTISFDDNLATIDHEVLSRTVAYEQARGGLPKTRPIEHYQLINKIVEGIESKTDKKAAVGDIYTTERQSMMIMHKKEDGICPVENFLLQRIVTKINISDNDKKNGLNSAVAISYTEKGIQLAFGTNVHACSNTMIWGQNFMSTFGPNKTEYSVMMDAFDGWMMSFEDKRKGNMEIIQDLKNRKVTINEMYELIGRMTSEALKANMLGKQSKSLNVDQVHRMVEHFEMESDRQEDTGVLTAWDVANFGTNDLKADRSARDLTKIYDTTHKYSNRIAEHFLDINLN